MANQVSSRNSCCTDALNVLYAVFFDEFQCTINVKSYCFEIFEINTWKFCEQRVRIGLLLDVIGSKPLKCAYCPGQVFLWRALCGIAASNWCIIKPSQTASNFMSSSSTLNLMLTCEAGWGQMVWMMDIFFLYGTELIQSTMSHWHFDTTTISGWWDSTASSPESNHSIPGTVYACSVHSTISGCKQSPIERWNRCCLMKHNASNYLEGFDRAPQLYKILQKFFRV